MSALVHEKVWVDKNVYNDAERAYYESLSKKQATGIGSSSLASEVAKARQHIKNSLECLPSAIGDVNYDLYANCKWSQSFDISVNPIKSQVIVIGGPGIVGRIDWPNVPPVTYNGVCIPYCNSVKNLDASFTNLSEDQLKLERSLNQAVRFIFSLCKYDISVSMDSVAALAGVPSTEINNKLNILEKENFELKQVVDDLRKMVISLQARVESIESANSGNKAEAPKAPVPQAQEDSDDGVDLFGSDDEEESAEAAKIREERLAAYNAKKSKKPVLIAKSNIILDVKPWDDETDMKAVEDAVRSINNDGLLWGAAKLVPLAFGIKKLQISSVVEDEKISVDWLIEEIEKFEDLVQSVDIAAFNKV